MKEIKCDIQDFDDESPKSLVGMYFVKYPPPESREGEELAGQIISREDGFYLYRRYFWYGDDKLCVTGKAQYQPTDGYGNIFVIPSNSIIQDAINKEDDDEGRRYVFFDTKQAFVEFCVDQAKRLAIHARRKK